MRIIMLFYILITGVFGLHSATFAYGLVTHGAITQKALERVIQADAQFVFRLGISDFSEGVTDEYIDTDNINILLRNATTFGDEIVAKELGKV